MKRCSGSSLAILMIFGVRVFLQSVGVPWVWASLLAGMFFILTGWSLFWEFWEFCMGGAPAVAFSSVFGCVNNVLSIVNNHFNSFIESMYPSGFEVGKAAGSSSFTS